jgi:predicted secreted protein
MAIATGNSGIVKLVTDTGGSDTAATVAEVRSFTINEEAGTVDSTSMGSTSRSYLATQKTGSVSLECYWDSTDAAQDDLDVSSKVDFEIYPNGVGTGKKYTGFGFVTSKSISVSFDGMVEASFEIQADGDITEGAA